VTLLPFTPDTGAAMNALLLRSRVVAALALGLAGCGGGSGTVPVRGTVTYKGKSVPSGTVTFIPDAGPHATGEIGPDGSYTLTTYKAGDGAVPGSYKVVVVAMEDTSNRLPEERASLPPPIVPTKYTSVATTDLTAQVKDGENTIDFELKGDVTK
jgi:hypothetical protein